MKPNRDPFEPTATLPYSELVMKHAILLLLPISTLLARDIHVGKEAPTIHAAIKAAQPGDTIHLEPKVYRDYAGFYLKKGEQGKPITLDGHGATLEGSDPIDPAKWREVSPGLFANDDLLPGLSDAAIGRWFFLFDGKMQLMGRTSKGRSAALKKPEELQAGEWTFVKDASREKPPSKAIYGTFYLKLAAGQSLAEAKVFAPMRSAGVQFGGDNAHLVIKNLTATHPYNDGFNIHGDCRDVVFENIRAIECGDDGISAHESAQYRVDGFVSIGNSTGICDTGTAQTSYNRVFIADCIGFDLYFLDNGRYKLTNTVIFSKAQNPFTVTSRDDQHCKLEMDNVLFRRLVEPRKALIAKTALVLAKRLTMEDITFDARGELRHEGMADVAELMKLVPKDYQP
ncbi:MAG: right-handed parallel beta-helix repeat-containing protein [Verrucomicrobia bacterium]|nr:right-handed parallel beta-helix repeat-containing protein [Verrucomicrobiota bacterium]